MTYCTFYRSIDIELNNLLIYTYVSQLFLNINSLLIFANLQYKITYQCYTFQ